MLRYYPPAAQHKLGSPWIGPNQVIRQATGHTVGIQRDPENPIVFVHVDDLKLCLRPEDVRWTAGVSTAKSLCASMVAFRPGSHVSDIASTPSVDLSAGRMWPAIIHVEQPLVISPDFVLHQKRRLSGE